ncbi:MAG: DEAD/DEAH box helicase [Anaeromyxobacter sp.]
MNIATFADLKLSPEALRALDRAGFEHPTPIQAQAIPPALLGRDVIGTAATGTGKTAAFLLPIIDRLAARHAGEGQGHGHGHGHGHAQRAGAGGPAGPRALILAPTRELALQISEELERFGHGRNVRGAVVIGGVGMGQQAEAFRQRREVIVATPGRLVDHLQQGNARLDGLEVLVLDEADRMLDMGFKPQLDRILARVPRKRQTLLFSATMGDEVAAFARAHLQDPVRVEVVRSGTTASRAEQAVYHAAQDEKLALLLELLAREDVSTLVFTRTKRRADRVAKGVGRAGHKVARIHADRSQAQRRMALEGFKDGQYRVLVATDIAARGIDVADIGHVINFDLPHVPEDYVHRVGRTARAAASGRASSFTSPEEQDLLRAIEKLTRTQIPRVDVPRDAEVFQAELKRSAEGRANTNPPQGAQGGRIRTGRPGPGKRKGAARASGGGGGGRHGGASRGGAGTEGGEGNSSAGGGKPKLIGTWGPKRRR